MRVQNIFIACTHHTGTSCLAGIAVCLAISAADGLVFVCAKAVVFTLTLRPFHLKYRISTSYRVDTTYCNIIMMYKIAHPSASCLAGIAVSLAIFAADGLVFSCANAVVFTLTLRPFHLK